MFRAEVETQIITPSEATGERELMARGRAAMVGQRWREAVTAFELLLQAHASSAYAAEALNHLAAAYDALGAREDAAVRYRALARDFPDDVHARTALIRAIDLYAYLERWALLGEVGEELAVRKDAGLLDRVLALGAQGLSAIEAGEDERATSHIRAALDLVEDNRLGEGGRLPSAVAQLRFAQGELRRVKSERIVFGTASVVGSGAAARDFGELLEARCAGLLDAQRAFTEAMHAEDPHWATVSGYRVGDLYRVLHRDVMDIPVPSAVKSQKDGQIFYAAMHLRYRVLLEKGLRMMSGTLDLAAKTKDDSPWVGRAEAAIHELEAALADETQKMAAFPFTEAEMKRALEMLVARPQAELPAAGAASRERRGSQAGTGRH